MRYEPGVRLDDVVAIDTHVHVEVGEDGHLALPSRLIEAAAVYFGASAERPGLQDIADLYRSLHMVAVVFTVDAARRLGHPPNSSDEIARFAAQHNDVLIPFGSVDPLGADPVGRAARLVEEHGVRGFKFHPTVQGFAPTDERAYPLYEYLAAQRLPAVFHTGQTGIGAGIRGGAGLRLRLSDPMLLDDVAADFPDLDVVMAHPSVPWQDHAISIATHKTNTWIDLSGWSPKYFPQALIRAATTRLQDRVLFGSDYPLIDPRRWLRDFDAVPMADEVRRKILRDNAARLLGLVTTIGG